MYDMPINGLKKNGLLLALCLLSTFPVYSQQGQIKSLESRIRNSSGIDRFDALIDLVRIYGNINNLEALKYTEEASELAFHLGDTTRIVTSLRIKGQLLNRLSRNIQAEKVLLEILPMAKRNNLENEYKAILNNLAIAYTFQAKYDNALEIYFQTLLLREADKQYKEESLLLNNIGVVYFKLKNYDKALEFYQRALDLKNRINDSYDLDRLHINIGLCYNQLQDFSKALKYLKQGFKYCGDNCGNEIKVEGEFGLGVSYFNLNDFQESEKHFNESLAIAKKIGYQRFLAENLINLAHIYVHEKETGPAIKNLTLCEQISTQFGYNQLLIETYKEFSNLYSQIKNYEKASNYQNLYINLKDSIYSGELIDNLAKIQTNYAERENLKTIANKNEIIARQRNLNLAIVIIAVLVSLLVFVLYRSNRVKKKVNLALSEAKAIIEEQNRKLRSSNYELNVELEEKNKELERANESLLRVNEELDNFIYKTSHDIRGPLASLKGMCNVALMDVKDRLALSYLKKLDITAERMNTILTRLLIVNQINNSTVGSERIDFPGMVNDVLALEKKKGLPPRLKITKHIDDAIEFYSDKEFVRIILENLIDNAIKFYNDSDRVQPFVNITVAEEQEHVKIKVVDNGIGISKIHPDKIFQMFSRASERSETGGIGLYITKTATEKLGGTVNLGTTPEGYTEFFVDLPISSVRVMA